MKILQALVLLITLWSSRAEHVLKIQEAIMHLRAFIADPFHSKHMHGPDKLMVLQLACDL